MKDKEKVAKVEPPKRRMIACGKLTKRKWTVWTSLWRYLAATCLSNN